MISKNFLFDIQLNLSFYSRHTVETAGASIFSLDGSLCDLNP